MAKMFGKDTIVCKNAPCATKDEIKTSNYVKVIGLGMSWFGDTVFK